MLAFATLLHLRACHTDLLAIVADWLSARTRQPWSGAEVQAAAVWNYPLCEVRTALAEHAGRPTWALQVNSGDPRVPGRDWRLELTLRAIKGGGTRATVLVHASDLRGRSRGGLPVPYTQPALVRALLTDGGPDPQTPGMMPWPLECEADAVAVAERITDPQRAHTVAMVCRGETDLDVERLRAAAIGLADVVAVRPVMAHAVAATLTAVQAWPRPGHAVVFSPRRTGTADRETRLLFAAEARALSSAVLRLGAPEVLAAHQSLEQIQALSAGPTPQP